MPPLILHNVPDDELYVGDDGIQRPYAMVFPQVDGPVGRPRKSVAETGSFGKSTRRSRSRTGSTPAKREDPTIAAADKVFTNWFQGLNQGSDADADAPTGPSRRQSNVSSVSPPRLLASSTLPTQQPTTHFAKKLEPTEVVLRGYRSTQQQYAAINHYEQLAGRICEDYSREPPLESRRYKSELRDPALTRRRPLTPEERAKVNRADGGEHWIKVTFESADAADAAIYASPQSILGHLVFAEPYRNMPPARDEAIPDVSGTGDDAALQSRPHTRARRQSGRTPSFSGHARASSRFGENGETTSAASQSSSRTADTTTMTADSATVSSGTVTGATVAATTTTTTTTTSGYEAAPTHDPDGEFCRVIPSARRVKLLPAEQALLPQSSFSQRVLSTLPGAKWVLGPSMIGNQVPRTETGDFDWAAASLYWKLIYWLDATFGLFGGEILSAADKDD